MIDKINGLVFKAETDTCLISLHQHRLYRQFPIIISGNEYDFLKLNEIALVNYYKELKNDLPFKLETFEDLKNYTIFTKALGKITFPHLKNIQEILIKGELQTAIDEYIDKLKGIL